MAFVLKGNGGRGPKNDWPLSVVARLIKLSQDGKGAKEAFALAVEEFNATAPEKPLVLPESCTSKFATSVLWGMKKRFVKKCNNPKDKEQVEALRLAQEMGIGSSE
jgi:hypothetical protein